MVELIVPDVHCAGCISKIEGALSRREDVRDARLNLTTRRLRVTLGPSGDAGSIIAAVEALGYDCRRFDAAEAGTSNEDREGRDLLRSLAVAGFAAGNVMLLSVSVWSGAEGATRDLFHWISALIALPAIAYAGQPFFRSAWKALKARSLNMDVPISLAVILAGALSLKSVFLSGEEAFFDAAVMLLFFLLVGRYLDHRVRARARSAVSQLLSLWSAEATRISGEINERVPIDAIQPGDRVLVAAGERIPVDGAVVSGHGDIDRSVVTGESEPVHITAGDKVQAGSMNLNAPLELRVTATGDDTWLAQVVRLMENAESGRGRHVRLADRAARIYAPAVHLAALLTFIGWTVAGAAWGDALWIAVSVLIITCPCALGLAVPAVQVVASGVLFRAGILVKDGGALERLAEADRAVFDKTGTLTTGSPVVNACTIPEKDLPLAAALARQSRHPLARALAAHATDAPAPRLSEVREHPGEGLSAIADGHEVRLGARAFAGPGGAAPDSGESEIWFSIGGEPDGYAVLADSLRPGAARTISELNAAGLEPSILSGDNEGAVIRTARAAGIAHWRANQRPEDKIAILEAMKAEGLKPLMVGDGINDGPALAAAHVSMAPAEATDVGRAAADLIFTGGSLEAVPVARSVARLARRLILQNFAIAAVYNMVAIPIAVLGGASPLVAAIAMSGSSIVVTLNALRLRGRSGVSARRALDTVPGAREVHA
ncbi:MAG: heavy metal translocating P-type ATPase [Minwuia sp.]|uniref:heavy metal translocating P-type ATPase n=1 Tax=Minwuia sp. TaxID=2493630 RepID=UPI003A8575B9